MFYLYFNYTTTIYYFYFNIFENSKFSMARYESLIQFTGTIDNLVFYQLNGINVVRKKSGFNVKDFKSKDSYKKVRENSSEFGHCSKIGKLIRVILKEYIDASADKYLYQSFAKTMTLIKDQDIISERGQRNLNNGLKTERGQSILRQFKFGNINNFEQEILKLEALFSISLHIPNDYDYNSAELMTIKIDFQNYKIYSEVQTLDKKSSQSSLEYERFYSNHSPLLYFLALKKAEKIVRMGFI